MRLEAVKMSNVGREVSISQKELLEIKSIFESVMNLAANGLFFRAGQVLGKDIALRAEDAGGDYLKVVGELLVKEGWVRSAELDRDQVVVEGSLEVRRDAERSCNMLRGIIAEAYAHHYQSKLFCHEVECASGGGPRCVFRVRSGVL